MRVNTILAALGTAALLSLPLSAADPAPAADNSAVNQTEKALTPVDQSNEDADIKVTAEIRKAVVANKDLSTYAHNVKIITTDKHVVHLRGTVTSEKEKAAVGALAKKNAGKYPVKNELLVEPKS